MADQTATIVVPAFIAATLGFIVFFLGAFLTRRVAFLKNYNIPEPVSGGIAVAVLTWIWFWLTGREIIFEMDVRVYLLVLFFATIGLNARIADLLIGGRLLFTLLVLTVGFMLLQNLVGLLGVTLFGLPNAVSVLLESASLIGGHGAAIAWGPQIGEMTGFDAAAEVGIATATLGLVLAALIGGPIANGSAKIVVASFVSTVVLPTKKRCIWHCRGRTDLHHGFSARRRAGRLHKRSAQRLPLRK